jgi:HNH endonuclease/AP2 domain
MKPREAKLDHETLTRILDYDPENGVFRWKAPLSNRVKSGQVAGLPDYHGHIQIGANGDTYSAHRLAWFYVHKVWPENEIDHINRIRNDNRIANLREANRYQNSYNKAKASSNSTGFKGVTRHKAYPGKFMAQIVVEKKNIYLGIFETAEAAHAAYAQASKLYHGEYGSTD